MGISARDRRPLGRTGMEVSPIGYGGSPLGGVFGGFNVCTNGPSVSFLSVWLLNCATGRRQEKT